MFYHLAWGLTSITFAIFLLFRSKSLGPGHAQETKHQESGITGNHFRSCNYDHSLSLLARSAARKQ